ncbi:50S ribosomal subunit protein L24 [Erysipelotrichaceae bacterium]|nr:50S ribosomal subunit protein L24 [Erysipelotrichaceae bacterium]
MHIRKEDLVQVIAGKDKKHNKQGIVLKVFPKTNKVLVEGVNLVSKHKKSNGETPGGIVEVEAPIHASNVQLICPETKKTTRVRYEIKDGKKIRISVRSGKAIDNK